MIVPLIAVVWQVLASEGARAATTTDSAPVCTVLRGVKAVSPARWQTPLDRRVTLHIQGLSPRTALELVAAAAGISIAYSSDVLSRMRPICATFESVQVGDVLRTLLNAANAEPIPLPANQVVLAPVRPSGPSPARPARALAAIVVKSATDEFTQSPASIAQTVINGDRFRDGGEQSLAAMLNGGVPGLWVWQQSPSTLAARYASIRGASSFGVSYPKVYIDGIQVANPLLLSHFSAEAIERVEVIRGPQGAALYGADATSGVINIVTRHDAPTDASPRAMVRTGAGISASAHATRPVIAQDYAMSVRAGLGLGSAGLGASLSSLGDFVPSEESRQLMTHGDFRLVASRLSVTGMMRYSLGTAGVAATPPPTLSLRDGRAGTALATSGLSRLSADSVLGGVLADSGRPQSAEQVTIGATAVFSPGTNWTHTLVAGIDGYRLANVALGGGPIPSATDSALRAARGSAQRGTVRASSTVHAGSDAAARARLTVSVEHSRLHERAATPVALPSSIRSSRPEAVVRANSGVTAQSEIAVRQSVFVAGGVRLERSAGYGTAARAYLLPMTGVSVIHDADQISLKVRAAYGAAVRPAATSLLERLRAGLSGTVAPANVVPERQAGTEVGADLAVDRLFAIHVTRFDQRASALIQAVPVASAEPPGIRGTWLVSYQLQNVGEIANRGWELQASATASRLLVSGSLTMIQSTVQRVADGYTGDLRAHDRPLEVPARTASLALAWRGSAWSTSWTATRAFDWTNYDQLAIREALKAGSHPPQQALGSWLRGYWRDYDGATRLHIEVSRDIFRRTSVTLTGDNLLGTQTGEPDNATIVPGRTIVVGLRARF